MQLFGFSKFILKKSVNGGRTNKGPRGISNLIAVGYFLRCQGGIFSVEVRNPLLVQGFLLQFNGHIQGMLQGFDR
jgi:hypothetical protein